MKSLRNYILLNMDGLLLHCLSSSTLSGCTGPAFHLPLLFFLLMQVGMELALHAASDSPLAPAGRYIQMSGGGGVTLTSFFSDAKRNWKTATTHHHIEIAIK